MSEDSAADGGWADNGSRRRDGAEPGTEIAVAGQDDIGALVGEILDAGDTDSKRRAGLLGRLAAALSGRARAARDGGAAGGRWLADMFANEIAPRIPVRDRETLMRHHEGLDGEDLADALARNASHATTTVGAAGGALAAVQFTAPPLLLSAPAQIVAETVVVAAVEVKLIAELHEVYGAPAPGSRLQRTSGYVAAWARKRGIDPLSAGESLSVTLGAAAKAALRRRLLRLMGRHLSTLGPYLTGAVAGGALNRAATRALAESVRKDLRGRGLPDAPATRGLDSDGDEAGSELTRGR
ncbi:hypothetical protein [Streptomonospora litoralis]|uniref:EcsC protein family protein n=1 Tax=Streptomonospora litoralis TaxID=2498135 RepID=A0A4P6Q7E4_9ACTN|nr:hypothetical protein [Streptomonospora litoralis]QBI54737.1 hypothetical protein EKD16_14785 [Streptomonospora litoralis]